MAKVPICVMISKISKRCALVQVKVTHYPRTTLISKVCPNPFVLSFKTKLQTEEVVI